MKRLFIAVVVIFTVCFIYRCHTVMWQLCLNIVSSKSDDATINNSSKKTSNESNDTAIKQITHHDNCIGSVINNRDEAIKTAQLLYKYSSSRDYNKIKSIMSDDFVYESYMYYKKQQAVDYFISDFNNGSSNPLQNILNAIELGCNYIDAKDKYDPDFKCTYYEDGNQYIHVVDNKINENEFLKKIKECEHNANESDSSESDCGIGIPRIGFKMNRDADCKWEFFMYFSGN